MAGMALSSLTGLITTMLVSNSFGTSAELDAFYAANRLTEIIFNLMAGGALASAFVPTFTEYLALDNRKGAWRLAASVGNLVIFALTLIALLAAITAPWLVRNILAPGFEDPAQIQLTVDLLRIMLISAVIFGGSGLIMGILNAHQHFALPGLAPAFYRLGWILGIFFLVPRMGIFGLAWGVVIGAGLHLLIQLPALMRLKPTYYRTFGLQDPSIRQVGRLMGPRLLGVAVVQINFLVNTILASAQSEGSLAALSFALQLMIMPQAIIAQATAIAALPTFSEQAARGDYEDMRSSLLSAMRSVLYLSLPASLGIILLRKPLVSLLLERGAFSDSSTELVTWALLWYALGLVGHAILEIVVRAFYAMKNTRTPVMIGVLAMSLNLALSLLFLWLFERIGWAPHGGLALANSLATAIESLALILLLRKMRINLQLMPFVKGLFPMLGSATIMGLVLLGWRMLLPNQSVWIAGLGGVAIGGLSYIVASLALKLPEPRLYLDILRERFGSTRSD
jgi:putative peptidoglycan lipid II flippase